MAQRLFSAAKVGLFCDSITHATEKRKGDDVKIVTLTLRVQPFDAKLATALDEGIGGESNVRPTLFKIGHPDPKPLLRRADFALGCARQNLHVFASTDTPTASILLDQVRISNTYARTEKGVAGFGFVLKASFGPLGRRELEYIQDWHLGQRFVTFDEAEPSLAFESDGEDEGTEADQKSREVIDGRVPQKPMWDDDVPVTHVTDDAVFTTDKDGKRISEAPKVERAHRKLHSHTSKKKNAKRR